MAIKTNKNSVASNKKIVKPKGKELSPLDKAEAELNKLMDAAFVDDNFAKAWAEIDETQKNNLHRASIKTDAELIKSAIDELNDVISDLYILRSKNPEYTTLISERGAISKFSFIKRRKALEKLVMLARKDESAFKKTSDDFDKVFERLDAAKNKYLKAETRWQKAIA